MECPLAKARKAAEKCLEFWLQRGILDKGIHCLLYTSHSSKTMHTSYGDMDVAIPRDRNGDYEPQLIKKYQNTVTLQGAMPLSPVSYTHLSEVNSRKLYDGCKSGRYCSFLL